MRKKFLNEGDELNCCVDDVLQLMRDNALSSAKGRKTMSRFRQLLDTRGNDDGSILLPQYWALYFRSINDERKALTFLIREIQLIERLFEIEGPMASVHFDLNRELAVAIEICTRLECRDLRDWLAGKLKN
jgi:hypothetical protein